MGHVTRALSFCAAVKRWNATPSRDVSVRVSILANSPFLPHLPIDSELVDPAVGAHQVYRLEPNDPQQMVQEKVRRFFGNTRADKLIIDTFPRGLGGELADHIKRHTCHQVLIHRNLSNQYCEQFEVHEFARNYDQIIQPGEFGPLRNRSAAFVTPPWLVRNQDELLSEKRAREKLGVSVDEDIPLAVVVGCGRRDEVQFMANVSKELKNVFSDRLKIRFVSPIQTQGQHTASIVWPLIECLPAVSMMIGSGGYNTVNEARATGTRLFAFAQQRMYDRQHDRLNENELCNSESELHARIDKALCEGFPQVPIEYKNGADQAVEIIRSGGAMQAQQQQQ